MTSNFYNRSIIDFEKNYILETDWEIKENANENRSFSNFLGYILDKILSDPENIKQKIGNESIYHFTGDLYIHKLPLSLYVPYCAGWSIEKILKKGLKTPTVNSKPAKHFNSAINHIINFTFLVSNEWTGATAFSGFDLYMAPFVRHDSLNYKEIKQNLQTLLFESNYPSRIGFQSPFLNITIVLDLIDSFLEAPAIVDGREIGKLNDYFDEALLIVKALCELYREGDANGAPFTFPIPTLTISKKFDWNDSRWDGISYEIFKTLAERGTFYLLNGYATNVDATYAMCCRLNLDVSKTISISLDIDSINEKIYDTLASTRDSIRGIWAIPDATGSINVVTINIPRLAYLSKGNQDKLEDLLWDYLQKARNILNKQREIYIKHLKLGLLPITKEYLGTLNNHFNTFGVIGLPEAAATFIGDASLWTEGSIKDIKKAIKWMKSVVSFIRKASEIFEEEDRVLYNVEEIPAESASYKLALKDYNKFEEAVNSKDFVISFEDGIPFYSNSIVPYYAPLDIYTRAKLEGIVQQEFTGGVMMHLFLNQVPDPEALRKLVKKIVTNTKVVYFSITPTISVCRSCKTTTIGAIDICPKCNTKVELWSRIVGYYKPLSTWNISKVKEFNTRMLYNIIDEESTNYKKAKEYIFKNNRMG